MKGRVKALVEEHQQEMKAKQNENNLPEKENLLRDFSKAVYPSILADPDVPTSEKELRRLQDDAIFLMMAATDAPAQVLAITIFHILNNPSVYERLRKELFSAIQDAKTIQAFKQFESIPYLVRPPPELDMPQIQTYNVAECSRQGRAPSVLGCDYTSPSLGA